MSIRFNCLLLILSLAALGGCDKGTGNSSSGSDGDSDTDTDTDSDADTDSDTDSDADGDTDSDSEYESDPVIDDMCADYPDADGNFNLRSVISNYTFHDVEDNTFEVCELAEDNKLLLLLITNYL